MIIIITCVHTTCSAYLPHPVLPLQELCEVTLSEFFDLVRTTMYDASGGPRLDMLAPMLHDICQGMVYLHSRNIVHGGRGGGGAWSSATSCMVVG